MTIRSATRADAQAIATIYNHYIRETVITFETVELTADDMAARIAKLEGLGLPWLVALDGDLIVGYAYAGPFKERAAYVHSLETSIYLDPTSVGRGLGRALFDELIVRLQGLDPAHSPTAPVHALIGGIALPNDASIALHEAIGMKKVAHFEEVGFKLGQWIDVGYWQMSL